MQRHSDHDDPFARVLAPPPDESAHDRAQRIKREEDAKRINDEIDERLKQDRILWKKHRNMFKLLLLGQSESGKSTTLKNFQLAFAPKAWHAERASWRAVIQLNLVRSVNFILDILSQEMPKSPSPASPTASPFIRPATASGAVAGSAASSANGSDSSHGTEPPLQFSHTHALLKLRLAPLRQVETDLKLLIGAATEELPDISGIAAVAGAPTSGDAQAAAAPFPSADGPRRRAGEYFVRANAGWRDAVRGAFQGGADTGERTGGGSGVPAERLERATEIIASCAEDMLALWKDETVRELLRRRKIKMELSPGFFLDDIPRIARRDYAPSDGDVVRSRLRTVGVQEYKLTMEKYATTDVAREWMIYDVGGARTCRSAWYSYFDDAHAILFLAPISCFDELLAEDRRVNRLEDSFLLWKGIVQSKLLAKCIIVLFLNKFDLLEKKLAAGVKVNRYLPSYADRENSAPVLARYLHQKFRDQHRECSPDTGRPFYGYVTTAIDTKATTSTLASVRDGILRHNLHRADFV